jgi:hypothetical protein
MEQHICIVCGQPFDTGALLLDKRMRDSMEQHTVTGGGLCPEHDKLFNEGYLALVAADESKSTKEPNGNIKPSGAYRTGAIVHIRREVARRMFNIPVPDDLPMMFCDPEVVTKLEQMMKDSEAQDAQGGPT